VSNPVARADGLPPAPPERQARGTVAFEPMAAVSNGLNLAQKGLYHELQSIDPGGSWEETFWIRPHSFGPRQN
jgi:aldose 1-epimerase